jgi:hypothetical protein
VWLAKDESQKYEDMRNLKALKEFKGSKELLRTRAFTASVPQVSVSDFVEFSINWHNLYGLTRLESIKFEKPKIEVTSKVLEKIEGISRFEERFHCEVLRKPEILILNDDWVRFDCFSLEKNIFNQFEPLLKCIFYEVACRNKVFRYFYVAEKPGIVMNCFWRVGIEVQVVEFGKETVTELKRKGLCFDRFKPVQLHVGDTLVIYFSK